MYDRKDISCRRCKLSKVAAKRSRLVAIKKLVPILGTEELSNIFGVHTDVVRYWIGHNNTNFSYRKVM